MKKFVALLFILTMILSTGITAFACTPQYDVDMPEIPEIHVELPEEYKDGIDNAVQEHLKDFRLLQTPEITKAAYTHFGSKSNLKIQWNSVERATLYEVQITKADGTSKTYTTDGAELVIKLGKDDFIKRCPKKLIDKKWLPAKVKVRAMNNDKVYSLWSEDETIGCNVIHIGELFKGRKK
ncbi:MAG: hypothetical protein ACI4S2_01530 [Lachnospiraceae bacterium]